MELLIEPSDAHRVIATQPTQAGETEAVRPGKVHSFKRFALIGQAVSLFGGVNDILLLDIEGTEAVREGSE